MLQAIKCPSCSANLQVPDDVEFVVCEYCETTIKVREIIRTETDYDVPEWMKIADNAYKGRNYDQAYDYYNMVLEKEAFHPEAWIGKGLSAGRLSEDDELRFDEMLQLASYGISKAHDNKKEELKKYVKKELLEICADHYTRHRKDKFDRKDDYDDYLKCCAPLIMSMKRIHHAYSRDDLNFKRLYSDILKNNLENYIILSGETPGNNYTVSEPKRTEYKNEVRALDADIKKIDASHVAWEDVQRKKTIFKYVKLALWFGFFLLVFWLSWKYIPVLFNEGKAKVEEISTKNNTASDNVKQKYEVVNKAVVGKKVIYTVFTESEYLSEIKDYASSIIKKDENVYKQFVVNFFSDYETVKNYSGKDIQLNKNQPSSLKSFSACVKYSASKDYKELFYYDKSKLTSEKF